MGQKVHPNAFRLGIYKPWQARWYADKDYTMMLLEDMRMRRLILNRLRNAGISKVETERSANQATVIIWTAKPGIVIGKGGASVDQLRDDLEKMTGKKVRVTIQEIKHPELDAMLVAQNVAAQLERRIAFRRAVKQSVLRTMRAGAKGVKIMVSGRLGGAEMSRREWDRDGRVPLHTLKANIDFGQTEARTTFGRIGVSVWVYVGDFDLTTREDTFEEIPARQLLEETRPSPPTDGAAADAAAALAAAGVAVPAAAPVVTAPEAAVRVPAPEAPARASTRQAPTRAAAPEAPAPPAEPEVVVAEPPTVEAAPAKEAPSRPRRAPSATAKAPAKAAAEPESPAKAAAEPKSPPRKRTPRASTAEATAEVAVPQDDSSGGAETTGKPARKTAARRSKTAKTDAGGGDDAKDGA
jgi:small subunit ribosomal protein S3